LFKKYTRMDSSEGNVWKYIFESDDAIAEAVLYRYESFEKRTVICCSVQSGCPVGCKFCGTGKRFIRNLQSTEITQQVQDIITDMKIAHNDCEKFQIMFMSMGEPMLNWYSVYNAIDVLHSLYPSAQLLISTIGINDNDVQSGILEISKKIEKVGLQFSIHEALEDRRNVLIPFKNKMTLRDIRDFGMLWNQVTGRKPFLNYCVTRDNTTTESIQRLKDLFSPMYFNLTFSVVCSSDETMKDRGFRDYDYIKSIMNKFIKDGYNCRMFDPAGQDDIGGGCGQLWYVQKWLSQHQLPQA
jgi:23S rRNA (adenine2503-C2)-methyltransferase